jgi:hypothetical protein
MNFDMPSQDKKKNNLSEEQRGAMESIREQALEILNNNLEKLPSETIQAIIEAIKASAEKLDEKDQEESLIGLDDAKNAMGILANLKAFKDRGKYLEKSSEHLYGRFRMNLPVEIIDEIDWKKIEIKDLDIPDQVLESEDKGIFFHSGERGLDYQMYKRFKSIAFLDETLGATQDYLYRSHELKHDIDPSKK